ncbi:class I SAM-dependent methyltransferase [Candidatus Woesebacteria bacterium]|nr:class I SAM-dependent methyltransferase [Candidatus Woesebacteria bacterium]
MSSKKNFYEEQYSKGETKGPRWYQPLTPWVKTREDVAFDIITELPYLGGNYLDLGCGEGDLVNRLAPFFKRSVGTDIAENRLAIANKKYGTKNVTFEFTDLDKKLPYRTNSFDVITCLGVIEYTFDPYFVMREINRVLKPGGILILEVPNLGYLPERLKLLFGILPSWPDASGWQGGRLHNFTSGSLRRLGDETGFTTVTLTGAGFMQPLRAYWPSLLCGDAMSVYKKTLKR